MATQINEIPSNHWCSDRERHLRKLKTISQEPDNIKIFVEETHLNMVLRMMHFYDLLIIKKSKPNSYEDVTNVLKFIGWNYHGIDEQFKVFFNDLNIDFSKQLTREQIRYIFKLWIYKASSEPVLLLKCFTYFDYNSDAYISKDEMLKILYRTIEERRIKLKNDAIPKLNVGVYYKQDLGFGLSEDFLFIKENLQMADNSESIKKIVHYLIEDFCNIKTSEPEYLNEFKELIGPIKRLIETFFNKNIESNDIPQDIYEHVFQALKIREDEIKFALLNRYISKKFPLLKDFDYQTKLIISSNHLSHIDENLINLDLALFDSRMVSIEMNKDELNKLINCLEDLKEKME